MVTVPLQVLLLPLTSVTVKTTVLAPTLAQVKLVGVALMLAMPQASLLPLSTWPAVILAEPAPFNCTVRFWQIATGATLSSTVTVAVQVLLLPLTSVTVKTSVFAPTSEQTKADWLKLKLAIPQASLLPLFTAAAVVLPLPVLSNWTVTFWQMATGATLSSTVIVVVQVLLLPFTSVTVKTSVFAPTSEQTKAVWLKLKLAIAQLSLLPLSTADAVVLPLPVLLSWTVTFWQSAVGAIRSWIVTVPLQVLLLPLTSVTVKTTVLAPTFAQLKLVGVALMLAIPQASLLPLFTWLAVMLATPDVFN
jgi:hypothetical protein